MEQTFIVYPMSQRFALEAGKTYTGSVNIVNPDSNKQGLDYLVSITPYGLSGDDQVDLKSENDHTLIKDWIKLSETSGTLAPNESKKIEFVIDVPANAPGGGQYATIAITSIPDDMDNSDQGVAVSSIFEISSIIYGYVDGTILHDGEDLENNVPGFSLTTPVNVSASLSNNGNVHEDANFRLLITNILTGEQIFPAEGEKGDYTELIMPDTTRHIVRSLTNLPSVGMVKVTQTIIYNGQYSTVEKTLYICPLWLLFIIALLLSALFSFTTYKIRSLLKKRKRKAFTL